MHWTIRTVVSCMVICSADSPSTTSCALTNPFTKPQVADRIRKVEDGVDEFQKYLNNRGEDAKNRVHRRRAAVQQLAARVEIQRTQERGGIRPSKQSTISKTPWTI